MSLNIFHESNGLTGPIGDSTELNGFIGVDDLEKPFIILDDVLTTNNGLTEGAEYPHIDQFLTGAESRFDVKDLTEIYSNEMSNFAALSLKTLPSSLSAVMKMVNITTVMASIRDGTLNFDKIASDFDKSIGKLPYGPNGGEPVSFKAFVKTAVGSSYKMFVNIFDVFLGTLPDAMDCAIDLMETMSPDTKWECYDTLGLTDKYSLDSDDMMSCVNKTQNISPECARAVGSVIGLVKSRAAVTQIMEKFDPDMAREAEAAAIEIEKSVQTYETLYGVKLGDQEAINDISTKMNDIGAGASAEPIRTLITLLAVAGAYIFA